MIEKEGQPRFFYVGVDTERYSIKLWRERLRKCGVILDELDATILAGAKLLEASTIVLVGNVAGWSSIPLPLSNLTLIRAETFMAQVKEDKPLPDLCSFLWTVPQPLQLSPPSARLSEICPPKCRATGESSEDDEGFIDRKIGTSPGCDNDDTESDDEGIESRCVGRTRISGTGCLRVLSWNVMQLLNTNRNSEHGKHQAALLIVKHAPHVLLLQV
jgi:hypothetical protein